MAKANKSSSGLFEHSDKSELTYVENLRQNILYLNDSLKTPVMHERFDPCRRVDCGLGYGDVNECKFKEYKVFGMHFCDDPFDIDEDRENLLDVICIFQRDGNIDGFKFLVRAAILAIEKEIERYGKKMEENS